MEQLLLKILINLYLIGLWKKGLIQPPLVLWVSQNLCVFQSMNALCMESGTKDPYILVIKLIWMSLHILMVFMEIQI